MFQSKAPNRLVRLIYPARCHGCGDLIPRGPADVYYLPAAVSRDGKAKTWHVSCYEQTPTHRTGDDSRDTGQTAGAMGQAAGQAVDSVVQQAMQAMQAQGPQGQGGQDSGTQAGQQGGSGQGPDGQDGQDGQGDTDTDTDTDTGDDSDMQNDSDQQNDAAQDRPKIHEQVCQILYDEASLMRHLHREDLWTILKGAGRGVRVSSAAKKEYMAEALATMARTQRHQEITNGSRPYYLKRADQSLRQILQVPDVLPDTEGTMQDIARARHQAQQAMEDALKAREQAVREATAREQAEEARKEAMAEAEKAREEAKAAAGRVVAIQTPDGHTVSISDRHHAFPKLAQLVLAGIPAMVVGPAGGGKTEACRALAADLDRPFVPLSLGPQTTQASLFGYTDAQGRYVRTPFREAFESGGLILLDEFDRCNERVSVTLNAAVAQRYCAFPDGTVHAHEDCVIVAAANTAGHGADRQYVSARQQDMATLDRFAVLQWDYDERFEEQLTLAQGLSESAARDWLLKVRHVRARVAELSLRYLVSPRASIQGARLMAAGADVTLALDTVLFRGWKPEDRQKVEMR